LTDPIVDALDNAEEMPPAASNAELARLPRNDTGNSERLIARHGHEMAWVPEVGWLVWDGKRWARERGPEEALRRAQLTVKAINAEAEAFPDFDDPEPEQGTPAWERWEKKRKRHYAQTNDHRKFAISAGNSGKTKAMLEMAAPRMWRPLSDFDGRAWHFNVQNGTLRLDLDCGLYPHRGSDRVTRIANVAYDSQADCPQFRGFVETILPDKDTALFVQKWFGYCLSGDISEQCFVMFDGKGSNGKSTLINAVAKILGDYVGNVPIETFLHTEMRTGSGPSPDLARLPGCRLVRTSEPQPGSRLSESRIKAWTGGEEMSARHLNKGFFDFLPCGKLTVSCNIRPKIAGKDEGIKSRTIVVPFKYRFPRRSKGRKADHAELMARAEGPGILNWLLDGFRLWAEDGLELSSEIEAATEDMFNEQDPIGQAVRDVLEDEPDEKVQASVLVQACELWFKRNGEEVKSGTAIGRRMKDLGYRKKAVKGLTYYLGVRINPDFLPTGGPL
jgi:putative DNA primase/helicase